MNSKVCDFIFALILAFVFSGCTIQGSITEDSSFTKSKIHWSRSISAISAGSSSVYMWPIQEGHPSRLNVEYSLDKGNSWQLYESDVANTGERLISIPAKVGKKIRIRLLSGSKQVIAESEDSLIVGSLAMDLSLGSKTQVDEKEGIRLGLKTHPVVNDSTHAEFTELLQQTGLYGLGVSKTHDGELTLNQGWTYGAAHTTGFTDSWVRHVEKLGRTLILATSAGLLVLDTKSTEDPTDDEALINYTTTTTPAIAHADVNTFAIDQSRSLIYVGSYEPGGVSVIDTKGTLSPADDETVALYSTTATPALAYAHGHWNRIWDIDVDSDTGFLYLSTGIGLTIIDTKKTNSNADDTVVAHYRMNTTPALPDWPVYATYVDKANGLIYASNRGGLSVIDTKNTLTNADDVTLHNYAGSYLGNIVADPANNLLFVTSLVDDGKDLSVINTKGTKNPLDDTITNQLPVAFTGMNGRLLFDSVKSHLYIMTGSGLTVVDTKANANLTDDEVIEFYSSTTSPSIADGWIGAVYLDGSLLYVSAGKKLSVVDRSKKYAPSGKYISKPFLISEIPSEVLNWQGQKGAEHKVSLRYRTGTSAVRWRNEFDDNVASEFSPDPYSWGHPFGTAVESNGTLKISNPTNPYMNSNSNSGADTWIDTGQVAGYFPAGSIVRTRFRINSITRIIQDWWEWFFTDGWTASYGQAIPNNQWYTFVIKETTSAFHRLGFEIGWKTGTWDVANDSLEIDWVEVLLPQNHAGWGTWSNPCESQICRIDSSSLIGKSYIQYEASLETRDSASAPSVEAVQFSEGFHLTGAYESENQVFEFPVKLVTFKATDLRPSGTSIQYYYSLDNGAIWTACSAQISFPEGTLSQQFKWKAELQSSDPSQTAEITSAELITAEP